MFDVDALYAPLTWDEFYARHFEPGEVHLARLPEETLESVRSLPALADPGALCRALLTGVTLFGPNTFRTVLSQATDALPFYDAGYTLYATEIDRSLPELRAALDDVNFRFGCSRGSVEAFCSRQGGGTAMHYDYDFTFQILLRGAKRWRTAKNPLYENPLMGHFASHPRAATSGADSILVDKTTFPKDMPPSAREFVAEPGTVLFLPRGTWHETQVVSEEAFGLNFVIKLPTWAASAASLVYSRLVESARWRAFAVGALSDDDGAGAAAVMDTVKDLRAALHAVVDGLTDHELLVSPNCKAFWWAPGSRPRVEAGAALVVEFDPPRPPIRLSLGEGSADFVAGLVEQRRPFRTDQVVRFLRGAPAYFVPHLLEQLVERGALVEIPNASTLARDAP